MKTIFQLTLINAWRNRYLKVFGIIVIAAFIISAVNSVFVIKAKEQQFEAARMEVRKAWLNQGPQNPHNSAHYGHYVFQPVYGVQSLDNGISQFAGSVLRLEAHMQNDPKFSPAESRTESSRFGDISFSWLLQVLMPLFIILLGFNTVSADREQQNLKLFAAQGISNRQYLSGKIAASFSVVAALASVGLIIQWAAVKFSGVGASSQDAQHTATWFGIYLFYFAILTTMSVMGSAWARSSKTSLLMQVSVWVLLLVIMPKLTANLGTQLYPLEQKTAFNKALREDREKGIDGHNPEDERGKQFQDSLLKHYKAGSLTGLPINADGLLMQADEEYANIVYDKHFARIRKTINRQNSISKYASVTNPFLAVRNLSMGLSQSDYHHHLKFVEDAEQYRRYLINNLNTKMAYGGSKTGDWDWKVDPVYWATVKDFEYARPSIQWSLQNYTWELLMLALWGLLSVILFVFTSKKMKLL